MAEANNWRANMEEDATASSSQMDPSTSLGEGTSGEGNKFKFTVRMPMRGEQVQIEAQPSSRERMRRPAREFGCPAGQCEYKATSKVTNCLI